LATVPPEKPETTSITPFTRSKSDSTHQKQPPATTVVRMSCAWARWGDRNSAVRIAADSAISLNVS
jgi:hypothetical protein